MSEQADKHTDRISLLEELYFGSVSVSFKQCDGKATSYTITPPTFSVPTSSEIGLFEVANKRNGSMGNLLGDEYNDLVVPAIPSADYIRNEDKDSALSSLPSILQYPLIKDLHGPIKGIQSGVRSALLKRDSRWFRLKGCGNGYDRFPIAPVIEDQKWAHAKQIRGCAFEHTTFRELCVSGSLAEILAPIGVEVANKPIGWWEYDLPASTTPYPKIKRCCILMETLGNRRLGDNVLLGLERLIPFLLVDLHGTCEGLLKEFSVERLEKGQSGLWEVVPTATVSLTQGYGGEMDFHEFCLNEKAPSCGKKPEFDSKWESIWEEACDILNRYFSLKKEDRLPSLLTHIYWRLGRECGTLCKTFSENDFSWGTYQDPLGFHCNAHVNNLVLLPESPHRKCLLSPLDFDMAYFKNTFSLSDSLFEDYRVLEINGMKMVLAGDSETSSGVTSSVHLDREATVVRCAVRDTMVVAFNDGLQGKPDKHTVPPQLSSVVNEAVHALLRLSLIVTEKETA